MTLRDDLIRPDEALRDAVIYDKGWTQSVLRLFRRRKKEFNAPLAPDRRVYAVGDIHGRMDLLRDLMDEILLDAQRYEGVADLVFLGDYVDRGEDSRAVLDFLIGLRGRRDINPVYILGNHERMLLDFLEMPEQGPRWLRYGGLQTLMSYGISTPGAVNEPETLAKIRADLSDAMGAHRAFLGQMPLWHRRGNMLFAHAGANPAKGPRDQNEHALLWGHPRFFDTPRDDELWVVHGHTVVEEPEIAQGRIAVDTGAYFSNRLTAVRIDGGEAVFLSV
ncbi:MAG: metallophosphoesterase family protein [Pseudomonadota bacterium]